MKKVIISFALLSFAMSVFAQGVKINVSVHNEGNINGALVLVGESPLVVRGAPNIYWSFFTSLPAIPIRFKTMEGIVYDCYTHNKRLFLAPGIYEGDTIQITFLNLHYSMDRLVCECDGTACLEK